MRTLTEELLYRSVYHGIRVSSYTLPGDISKLFKILANDLKDPNAVKSVEDILEHSKRSKKNFEPLLKDTGHFNIFISWGDKVTFNGTSAEATIQKALKDGSKDLFLKPLTVIDPLFRKNTGDNLPGIIHWEIIEGEAVKITVLPQRASAEKNSKLIFMEKESHKDDIIERIVGEIKAISGNTNEPMFIGIGLGGNAECVQREAKKAMIRAEENSSPFYLDMEEEIYKQCNAALGNSGEPLFPVARVRINTLPCHAELLPMAICSNMSFNQYWTSEI